MLRLLKIIEPLVLGFVFGFVCLTMAHAQGTHINKNQTPVTNRVVDSSSTATVEAADSTLTVFGTVLVTFDVTLRDDRDIFNAGTGIVTLICSSGTISGLGLSGAASIAIPPGNGLTVYADGSNCYAIGGLAPSLSPQNYTLTSASSSATVLQNANVTDLVTINPFGGFTGSVTFSASGLPSGVSASFGTNPSTSTSLLTLTATSGASTGVFPVVVTGTSGTLLATTTINLTVATGVGTLSLTSSSCTPTAGSGSDDTAAIQGCLNTASTAGKIMEVPAGTYKISPSDSTGYAVTFPSGGAVSLDASVTMNVQNSFSSCGTKVFTFPHNNVSFTGASDATDIINMHAVVTAKSPTTCEFSHIFDVEGTSTGNFSGLQLQWAWGDGMYIRNSTNITNVNLILDHAFRNGMSITGLVNHIHNTGVIMQNTTGPFTHGQGVGGGLDIESNTPGDYELDITFTSCQANNNFGPGMRVTLFFMNNTSQAVSVTFTGSSTSGNGWEAWSVFGGGTTSPGGLVEIDNSSSSGDGYSCVTANNWPNNGAALTVRNFTCTNPHAVGVDPSGFSAGIEAFSNGAASAPPMGNIHFYNTNLSLNSNTQKYFWFSQNGCTGATCGFGTSVDFDGAGTMTGATAAPPNGIFLPKGGSAQNCAKVVNGVCT